MLIFQLFIKEIKKIMRNPKMIKQERIVTNSRIKTNMSQVSIFVNYYLISLSSIGLEDLILIMNLIWVENTIVPNIFNLS